MGRYHHHHHHHRRIIIIPIPSSTPQSLVFPYDGISKKFNTNSYMPIQTQNRISIEEIEQFLDIINGPIKEWYDEYGWLTNGSCKFVCLMFTCFIIMPLMFFFICWMACAQSKAADALQKAGEKAKILVRDNNQRFVERGLMWNVPTHFPRWIELWTQVGPGFGGASMPQQGFPMMPQQQGFPMMPQQQPGFDGFARPGIPTQTMPQQNFQNGGMPPQQGYYPMQQNQYNPNMYGPNGGQPGFA